MASITPTRERMSFGEVPKFTGIVLAVGAVILLQSGALLALARWAPTWVAIVFTVMAVSGLNHQLNAIATAQARTLGFMKAGRLRQQFRLDLPGYAALIAAMWVPSTALAVALLLVSVACITRAHLLRIASKAK